MIRVPWRKAGSNTSWKRGDKFAIAIASASDHFTFYGGTALSRTFLNGLRLSEDIDLLSHEVPHKQAARELDSLLAENLEPVFGLVTADRRLSEVTRDTDASIYTIGHSRIKVQLIDGSTYARWPAQSSKIDSRYEGLPHTQLRTFTRTGFVCAKAEAWFERNTPRDLYDLWALSELGAINNEAAGVYKSHGATNSFPQKSQFPRSAPTIEQWSSALSNQCIPKVGPDEAYRVVCNSWLAATDSGAREIPFRDK